MRGPSLTLLPPTAPSGAPAPATPGGLPAPTPTRPDAGAQDGGADSPGRAGSASPPPEGPQGALELGLLALAHALYALGTTAVADASRDAPAGGKPVGARVNDVVGALAHLDALADTLGARAPLQVLADVDGGRNPRALTRERLERAATENQFMNGKIAAVAAYGSMLDEALAQAFPDLAPYLGNATAPGMSAEAGNDGAVPAPEVLPAAIAPAPANGLVNGEAPHGA